MNNELLEKISEVTTRIEKDRDVLQKQIDLINGIDFSTYAPTEEEWHELMETPIRSNNAIVKQMIKNIFPDATNLKLTGNYMFFDLDDLTFGYATSRIEEINVFGRKDDLSSLNYEEVRKTVERIHTYRMNENDISFIDNHKKNDVVLLPESYWLNRVKKNGISESLEMNDKNGLDLD